MPADTILCWKSRLTQSGRVTVADYEAWRALGEQGRDNIAEFFRERIRERYIDPVLALDPDKKNGFSIMAVSCLLIETYETFRQGWPSSDKKSALAFCYFFDREALFHSFSGCGQQFYKNVRCGILHQGETTGGWKITRADRKPLFDRPRLSIHATKFHNQMAIVIDRYCRKLKAEPLKNEIWRHFSKKMNATIANCES